MDTNIAATQRIGVFFGVQTKIIFFFSVKLGEAE